MRATPLLSTAGLALGLALALAAARPAAAEAPPRTQGLSAQAVMALPAPPVRRYKARDGALLAYRAFTPAADAGPPKAVAILLHGSAGSSLNMTVLGQALAHAGVAAFALDVRGQGLSGRRGDIDYIGQQDDDLADFTAVARRTYPGARLVLVGHSAGGGFALRVAGEPQGRAFDRFVLLAPVLGRLAPTNRPGAGWARPDLAKIAALSALNAVGVTAFNGASVLRFNLPPGGAAMGLTGRWSYRMLSNYGPRGQMQLFGPPAYLADARNAAAPIVVVAGTADEQFRADRYALAFHGLDGAVRVVLAPGVDHMGVLSDPRAVALVVAAVG